MVNKMEMNKSQDYRNHLNKINAIKKRKVYTGECCKNCNKRRNNRYFFSNLFGMYYCTKCYTRTKQIISAQEIEKFL